MRGKVRISILVIILLVSVSLVFLTFIQRRPAEIKDLQQQEEAIRIAFSSITAEEISENIKLLSHAALEGRGTGSVDSDFVGEFLARELREYGFQPLYGESFFQEFYLEIELIEYKGEYYERGKLVNFLRENTFISRNVLGILYGTDLKEEIVIISAHYDHLGKKNGTIYYGADDNGSGIGAVLEIAEALGELAKQGIRSRRSILVAFWGAEELGLLGSTYFASRTFFSFGEIVAVINLDMIGRNDPKELYVIGSENPLEFFQKSPDIHQIIIEANKILGFNLIYDDQGQRYFERVDSYPLFLAGGRRLPAVTFTDGEHQDYHQTTDTFEKIDNEKVKRVSWLAFFTLWKIANMAQGPRYLA